MTRGADPIDILAMPELARLAEEVGRTRQPRVLRRGDAELAIISATRPRRRRGGKAVTQADIEAALTVVGAWNDWMDPEEFQRQRRELQIHDREPRTR